MFVIRRGLGDKPEFLSVKWKALRQGIDPNADIRLAPYHVVYVPKMGIGEVYQFYNRSSSSLPTQVSGSSTRRRRLAVAGTTVVTCPTTTR